MGILWPAISREDEPASITYESVQKYLQAFPSYIPTNLRTLDNERQKTIPDQLEQRRKAGDAFLEKHEITTLVDLKLKYGTYRPNLAKLVASNSAEDLVSTTKSAFKTYTTNKDTHIDSVNTLTRLKGVGPATASLFLSCYDPAEIPFFSDPLYRYVSWVRAHGQGWDRKIKYTLKEYKEMCEKVQALRVRLQEQSGKPVSAIDLEKVAYVLAKEAQSQPHSKQHSVDEAIIEDKEETQPPKPQKRKTGTATKDEIPEEEEVQEPRTKRRNLSTIKDSKQNNDSTSISKPQAKKSKNAQTKEPH